MASESGYLGVQSRISYKTEGIKMTHANTMTPEDVINTLDEKYRLSPYLKLRGHISFKAARLCGMYMARTAKLIKDNTETPIEKLDTFAEAMGVLRSQHDEEQIREQMGLAVEDDMWDTIKTLVMYANKLNFDMQELIDPTGKRRNDPSFKTRGIYFTTAGQRQSWTDSVKLLAEGNDLDDLGTYAEYVAAVDNPDWTLTEEEWAVQQVDDNSLYTDYSTLIVERILNIGEEECDFDELPIRAQISCIENMRGKIPSMVESALRGFKYSREPKAQKTLEASKVKGLINGFDKMLCAMLDSPRYANYAEFMYNYIPQSKQAEPVSRRMIARREKENDVKLINMKFTDEQLKRYERMEDMANDLT